MTAAPVTLAELRSVDLFDDLDDAALAEWLPAAQAHDAAPGDVIAEYGQTVAGVQLLLAGEARSLMLQGDRAEPVGHQQAPTWMGAISALTGSRLEVRMQAETHCRLALIPTEDFRTLAFAHPAVHQRVMSQVAPVISRLTSIEQHRERLAALGTMAAGLAHELNNPAAAARRAAAQMSEALDVIGGALGRFVEAGVERVDAQKLVVLQRQAASAADARTPMDTLDAADAEDALTDRLEQLGVAEPWRLAEPLAAAGVDDAWLDAVAAAAGPSTGIALGWIAATLTARGLAGELQEATQRMSDLVGAVKSYAYMDRGDLVEVDIHEGLETTLVVLGHKLKHTSIAVERHFDRDLPKLTVRGSELNQVWTNLLGNAIDALGDDGHLTITTARDGSCAVVEVSDDGPGVPPDALDRIFDPFFTTKEVGQGTGLGLATARRIVVDRHDGSLTVDSRPGRTTFRVQLPFAQR